MRCARVLVCVRGQRILKGACGKEGKGDRLAGDSGATGPVERARAPVLLRVLVRAHGIDHQCLIPVRCVPFPFSVGGVFCPPAPRARSLARAEPHQQNVI